MEYSPTDKLIMRVDEALVTIFGSPKKAARPYPTDTQSHEKTTAELSDAEKQHAAALMRVNHAGEVCAQALYQSQALTARSAHVKETMQQAALEENDHLAWCAQRIDELGGQKSLLNPIWYAGSFGIGTVAGLAGDKWSLGFIAETERQVVKHLESHLNDLPEKDTQSRAVVEQMRLDEADHATQAVAAGASELPKPIKQLMGFASKLMTNTADKI
ncbi:MAG: ubiquinone biosynthesis monooxygenase Coq7 [Saprospiraceae bacterium]|jgi:ubiquinone biosynthesis monooxygenase Coq7